MAWTLYCNVKNQPRSGAVPVFLDLCALILQVDYLSGVMAAHFSVGVVDDAVFVISAKQL